MAIESASEAVASSQSIDWGFLAFEGAMGLGAVSLAVVVGCVINAGLKALFGKRS